MSLLWNQKEPAAEVLPAPAPREISPEEEEAVRRGAELMQQALEARDRREKQNSGEE